MRARAEFTVEPFVDGDPGAHVAAAIEAVRSLGLDPEIGPFATTVSGDVNSVNAAVAALLEAASGAGAHRVSVQIDFMD